MEKENKDVLEPQEEEKVVEDVEAKPTEETEETVNEVVETEQQPEVVEETKEEKEEEPYTGKEVTTSIKYDFRTMKYFNMYNTVIRRKLPVWYIVMAVLSFAFATYTVVSGIIQHNAEPEKVSMTSSIIFGLIFSFFTVYLVRQAVKFEDLIDKTIVNHFQTHKVAEQHIRIREDKITLIPLNKPDEPFSYDWLQVTSIEEIDQFFYLYIGKAPIIISKDPNNMVEGTYEEMMEIIDEKIKTKPYKVCKKKFVKKPITYVHKEDLEAQEEALHAEAENVETVNPEEVKDTNEVKEAEVIEQENNEEAETVEAKVVEENKENKPEE